MKKINLRDYYPFYTKDTVVEVPEEIALLLREYELLEEAYRIRTYRYKAFYSLDYAGGIERDMAALEQKNPCDLVEQLYDREQLYKALASLPEKQRNRIYAHYFLGMSKSTRLLTAGCWFERGSGSYEKPVNISVYGLLVRKTQTESCGNGI